MTLKHVEIGVTIAVTACGMNHNTYAVRVLEMMM